MTMKKLLLGLLAAAVVTLTLAGCKNNSDNGTAPTLNKIFWTENDAFDTYDSIDSYPNKNNAIKISVIAADGQSYTKDNPYALALSFSDPDQDVNALYTSFDNTFPDNNSTTKRNINQKYENQLSVFSGIRWTGGEPGVDILYAVLEDAAGNRSNVVEIPMNFIDAD